MLIAQKYFRKAGVLSEYQKVKKRGAGDPVAFRTHRGVPRGGEHLQAECSSRLAVPGPIGLETVAIVTTQEDAQSLYDEMRHILASQRGAPNSRNGQTPVCTGPMHRWSGAGDIVDYKTGN